MYETFTASLFALVAVTLAEMGDKTQLLAMCFATKYKATKVLVGVFIATVLNHALAVALGTYVARYQSLEVWIQIIAALSFIFFGLWTIRGDSLDCDVTPKSAWGAVMTVAIAFFIAELGDKTQLATIAIATKFPENPIGVLMGSTMGMMIADAFGIVVGVVMCKRLPERTIKLVSAVVFIIFGLIGTGQVAHSKLNLTFEWIIGIIVVLTAVSAFIGWYLYRKAESEQPKESVADDFCVVRKEED